ncbi:MAG: NifU family protein, partial [Thermoguttaceae bacterium]
IRELNLHSIPEITAAIKAGGACMACHHTPGGLHDLIQDVWKEKNSSSQENDDPHSMQLPIIGSGAPISAVYRAFPEKYPASANHTFDNGDEKKQHDAEPNLSPFQFAKQIEKWLDEYLRPMVKKDGGDLELIDIKEKNVYIELRGACAGCAGAGQTLKFLIERTLKEKVDPHIRVIQV